MSQSQPLNQSLNNSLQQLSLLLTSQLANQQPQQIISIPGPVSFILRANLELPQTDRLGFLNPILDQYCEFLQQLAAQQHSWINIDESALQQAAPGVLWEALEYACSRLSTAPIKLLLSGINQPAENLDRILDMQIDGIELDLTSQPALVDVLIDRLPPFKVFSAKYTDLSQELALKLEQAQARLAERLWVTKVA